MLTRKDRLRIRVRDLEFRLPPSAIRRLGLLAGLQDPYLPEDDSMRAIFVHIPKSAGTSLRAALYSRGSFHVPAIRYKAFDSNRFDAFFKFCFVRNPWARLFSAFNYLQASRDREMTFPDHRWAASYLGGIDRFDDFVLLLEDRARRTEIKRYIHFRDQIDWISERRADRDRIIVDHIGRFENLPAEYEFLSRKLGINNDLPVIKKGNEEDYRKFYTTKTVDIVAKVYERDIDALGYEFE